jgi:hypothetical protein
MVFSEPAQRMVSPAAALMLVMGMVTIGTVAAAPSASAATVTVTVTDTGPAADGQYDITALGTATGSATFTRVPATQLSASPQPVASATNVAGNTTVTWNPTITVTIPGSALAGAYTATITHSVS